VQAFFADASTARVGLTVAVADVTGDGRADVVTGTGPGGGPRVTVFDGQTGAAVRDFFAYDPSARGGVNVAAGDMTGDGRADIVTAPGRDGGPHVRVFDGAGGAELRSFFAAAPGFTGGISVAAVDSTGDGIADVVTAQGPGGGPQVRVYDGPTGAAARSFFAYTASYAGGVTTGNGWYVIPPPTPPVVMPVFMFDAPNVGLNSFVPSVFASLAGGFIGSLF
jgi:hypothetical protein